jgi:hypothetical protein
MPYMVMTLTSTYTDMHEFSCMAVWFMYTVQLVVHLSAGSFHFAYSV